LIAVDTNLLVYAHREESPWHAEAYRLIEELAEETGSWAIPWPCIHEFIAIVTHPRIFAPPTPLRRAVDQVDAWLEAPGLVILSEDPDYWSSLRAVLLAGKVSGPLVHDARVAAICLQHGVKELWSADRDFSRFSALRVRNPLA
jgi:uncharacterized protein